MVETLLIILVIYMIYLFGVMSAIRLISWINYYDADKADRHSKYRIDLFEKGFAYLSWMTVAVIFIMIVIKWVIYPILRFITIPVRMMIKRTNIKKTNIINKMNIFAIKERRKNL